jgi:hypothetical protein
MDIPISARKKSYGLTGLGISLTVLLFLAGWVNLASFPPLWWDEGWTLSVARNWAEHGHYGRLLAGKPIPPGLEAAFPVTSLVGLSFHLFGVGIWQGRLIGVVSMVGAMGVMTYLALRLWNPATAIATWFVLLGMSAHPSLHPLYMGRQALAEMPMLFYLLSGYAFFSLALEKSKWFLAPAVVLWGISLISKAQVTPFWVISLGVPILVSLVWGERKKAGLLFSLLLGSLLLSRLLAWAADSLLFPGKMPGQPLHGMYEVTAFVVEGFNRLLAFQATVQYGLPALIGFGFAAVALWPKIRRREMNSGRDLLLLSLLGLGGSWLAWYALFSVGWPRYLFPPLFIGGLFVGGLFHALTDSFRWRALKDSLARSVKARRFDRKMGGLLLAAVLILMTSPPTMKLLYQLYAAPGRSAAAETADFLHSRTAADALIETYESELHFLLNRRVHYPPDQIHVELNRRAFLGQTVLIDYDPLAADPDYLVVGAHGRMWRLYDPVVASGAFRLWNSIGPYQIYGRVR